MMCAIRRFDAGLCEFGNVVARLLGNVDNIDVWPVELFIVVLLQTGPLDPEWVRRLERTEQIPFACVVESGPLLLGPEIIHISVGCLVEEIVFVVPEPEGKPAVVPEFLIEALSFFRGHAEYKLLVQVEAEAAEAALTLGIELWVERLSFVLFLGGEVSLAHWDSQVRGSLVDLEVAGNGSPLLSNLNARRTSSDDGTTFATDVYSLDRPE